MSNVDIAAAGKHCDGVHQPVPGVDVVDVDGPVVLGGVDQVPARRPAGKGYRDYGRSLFPAKGEACGRGGDDRPHGKDDPRPGGDVPGGGEGAMQGI